MNSKKPALSSGELEELKSNIEFQLDCLQSAAFRAGEDGDSMHQSDGVLVSALDSILSLTQDYSNKRLEAVIGKLPEKRYHECGKTICDHAAPEYSYNQAIDDVTKLLKSEISHED